MSNDQFSNLMGQLSGEEINRRECEQRADRRHATFRKILSKLVLLIMIGALAAGFYYRDIVQAKIEKAAGILYPQKPASDPANNPKIKQIQEAAAKRDKALDEIMK
jgi:hypothetical protein